ncbi:MAG: epoxide hydrolase [Actinomycetota bacterium]|nr:epoxide hydrolase [Actinomycetota bacterium]
MTDLAPWKLSLAPGAVDNLRARLHATRWPDELPDVEWDYGIPLAEVRELCRQWADEFDFDAFVQRCNRYPQVRGTVHDEAGIETQLHMVHARSPHPQARPLLLVHGWPGSVVEFFDVAEALVDPGTDGTDGTDGGGDNADAFHLVMPSLPGYGFSGPTTRSGVDAVAVAGAIDAGMRALGYEEYFVQGGDWGSVVGAELGRQFPQRVTAVHLTLLNVPAPPKEERDLGLTQRDLADRVAALDFVRTETGYQAIQSTKPQTLAYALQDSPAGLAAWIAEKFHTWSDRRSGASTIPVERLLDNLSVYWFTGTIGSSMRLYYETLGKARRVRPAPVTVPVGHTRYPAEIYKTPRAWAERELHLVSWVEQPRGGHFPSLEVPDLFVPDLRAFFRRFR